MLKNSLRRLSLLSLTVLASCVAAATASAQANADWWRRQQQQQHQRQMEAERLRRQQQQDAERQRLREQERQRLREQERARLQQEERNRLIQRQRAEAANDNARRRQAANDNVQRNRAANDHARRRGGGANAVVARSGDRILYANGVAKLNRAPTAGELRRGFTGKVTRDGRALVKVNDRVYAVPAARLGVRLYGVQGARVLQSARLSAAKGAAVTAEVQKIARASLKELVRTGGPGGLSEKFNKAAGNSLTDQFNRASGGGRGGGGGNRGGGSGGTGGGNGGNGGNGRKASNDNNRWPRGRPPQKGELTPIFNDAARKNLKRKLDEPVPMLKPGPKRRKPANDNNPPLPPYDAPTPRPPGP